MVQRWRKIFKNFSESGKKSNYSIRLLKIHEKEIKDQSKILQSLYQFHKESFSKNISNSNEAIAHYLKDIGLPKLTKEHIKQCEGEITKNQVIGSLGNMNCNKIHGNDGLTSDFYETFWPDLETPLLLSYKKVFFIWRIKHFSKTDSY